MNIEKIIIYFTSFLLLFNNSNNSFNLFSYIYLPYYNNDNNYVKFYQLLM